MTTQGDAYDVVVVGAGLLGLATARDLLIRRPGLRVAVLDKESQVAAHQSSHNSGVIHAGMYYAPGSMKARLCVAGSVAMKRYCAERGIAVETCGKLIVATADAERGRLTEIYRQGRANGVAGLELIGPERIREIEPHCDGVAAIWSPATAIVDFGAVACAYAADIAESGGEILLGHEVRAIERRGDGVTVQAGPAEIRGKWLIACAGAWSGRVARMDGASGEPAIVPFRGNYWRLRSERRSLVRGLIYPVPDPRFPFLGVHFIRRFDGDIWVGPNALLALARDGYRRRDLRIRDIGSTLSNRGFLRFGLRNWRTGASELAQELSRRRLLDGLRRFVPELTLDDLQAGTSGVRAQAITVEGRLLDDFAFDDAPRAIHVRNAPSPAATSSLEIGRVIADRAVERFALAR